MKKHVFEIVNHSILSSLAKYYRDFRDEYRLQERIAETQNDRTDLAFPDEAITLIVIAEKDVNAARWLDGFGDQIRIIEEIVWLGGEDQTMDASKEFSGQIRFIRLPKHPKGQDVNRVIQNAKGSIIILMDTRVEPSPDWLVNILSPFNGAPEILFSIGRLEFGSFWQTLALHIQTRDYLPFWGFAFRKQSWARASGFPGDLPLYPAWMLFVLRLKNLPGKYARSSSAVACFNTPAHPTLILRQAYWDGAIGLFGNTVRKQLLLTISTFILVVLGITFFFFIKTAWLSLSVGLCFLFTMLIAGNRSIQDGGQGNPKPNVIQMILIGMIQQLHVIGYAAGVFDRKQSRLSVEREHENSLQAIIEQKKDIKNIIVYLPTHDWGFMFQRPQQLARHFAREGYLFFYCTRNEQKDAFVGLQEVEPNLFICATPPETFSIIQHPTLLIGSPWYAPMLDWFHEPLVIYDHYDDLEVSSAKLEDHEKLIKNSTLVLTSSQKLLQAVRPERPDVLFIPNAVDYSFVRDMRPSNTESPPDELMHLIQKEKPIIGYTGALASWFDYELVKGLADACPQWEFVLIGIDYDGSLNRSGLIDRPNIHWLGWKPYQDLFKYVWSFSVAMIPFIINDVTRATSPVKLFEYFACQKPVIATPLPECLRYPEVFVASDINTFSLQITEALKKKDSPQFCQQLDHVAHRNTWVSRVQQIEAALISMERRHPL